MYNVQGTKRCCTRHIAQDTLHKAQGTMQLRYCTRQIAQGTMQLHYYTLRRAIHSMLIVDAWPPVRNDNASHPDSIKDNSNAHLPRSFFALKMDICTLTFIMASLPSSISALRTAPRKYFFLYSVLASTSICKIKKSKCDIVA